MARGDSRRTDRDYLETLSTDYLEDLQVRLKRSVDELTTFLTNTQMVLLARLEPDHPLYGKPDEGDDPRKALRP